MIWQRHLVLIVFQWWFQRTKLSYILAELISKSKEVLFSRLLEGLMVCPCIKNVGERPTAKNYSPVSLLSVVSEVFEKLNNRFVDHLEKCGLFSDFQYGFKSSPSTADLLTVILIELLGLLTGLGLFKL